MNGACFDCGKLTRINKNTKLCSVCKRFYGIEDTGQPDGYFLPEVCLWLTFTTQHYSSLIRFIDLVNKTSNRP